MNRCGNKLNGGGYYKTLESVNTRLAPGESVVKRYDNLDTPLLKDMKLAGGRSCKKSMKAKKYHMKSGKKHMKKSGKKSMKKGKKSMKGGKFGCRQPVWNKDCQ